MKEKSSYKQLKETWLGSDLSKDRLMELARLFQRRPSSPKPYEEDGDERLMALGLLFEEL